MNRIATIAIAAAAVAGIAGGTFAATAGPGADDPQDAGRGSTGTTTDPGSSPSGTSTGDPVPFYLAGRTIVDGDDAVALVGITVDNVRSLERVPGGWFVVTATSPQEPAFRGTYVAKDGTTTNVGRFVGQWDLDEARDSVVARFGDYYQVRDVTTGEVTQELPTVKGADGPLSDAAFSGNDVITSWRDSSEDQLVVGIDLATGRQYDVTGGSILNYTTSADGTRLAGEQYRSQEVSGPTCLAGGPVDAFDEDGWETCDWRTNGFLPQFSPDGSRLLTVPYDTEGFGPTSFGILDARTGRVRNELDVPELVTDAVWADDDTLYLHGYADGDLTGGTIYECTLTGDCTKTAASKQHIVLGS
jgi:hypothetical protein